MNYGNNNSSWQGKTLGRYRLGKLLGRGGMGEVWLAEDSQLHRQVAVKLLPAVVATDSSYLQDFVREARTAAALEHPHILPVHDFGEQPVASAEVVPYLIMPYIIGGSLRDRIREAKGSLPVEEAIQYLKQAARAIDYAHNQHVLHRDIKPANMLLQQEWLFLADFGLAKLLTSSTYRSKTHAGSGTPEYMAPEQAQGHAEEASDRYSLAIVAYQLFTGSLPFRGETPYETLIKQIQEQPPSPRQLNPRIPQSVEDTILKGLAKRPEERPASSIVFVEALEHEWQIAQADPEATVLAPWSKRTQEGAQPPVVPSPTPLPPLITATHGVQSTIQEPAPQITTLDGVTPIHNAQTAIPHSEPFAVPETPRPEGQQRKIGRRTVLLNGLVATAVVATGGATLALLHQKALSPGVVTHKGFANPKKLMVGVPILKLTGHTTGVWDAVWDPTGNFLATASEDGKVMLWNLTEYLQRTPSSPPSLSKPVRSWAIDGRIYSNQLCWSANGHMLVVISASQANRIYVLDTLSSNSIPDTYIDTTIKSSDPAPVYTSVLWGPRADTFTVATYQQDMELWQPGNKTAPVEKLNYQTDNLDAGITAIGWSNDKTRLAGLTFATGRLVIWNAKTRAIESTFDLPVKSHSVRLNLLRDTVTWSPNAPLLAVTNVDVATIWDVQQKKRLLTLGTVDTKLGATHVYGLTWSPDGRYIAGSYGGSPRIYVWDVQTMRQHSNPDTVNSHTLFFPQYRSQQHTMSIIDVNWSPNGRYIATASFDKTVIVWKVDAA